VGLDVNATVSPCILDNSGLQLLDLVAGMTLDCSIVNNCAGAGLGAHTTTTSDNDANANEYYRDELS
jgi:hypothetical protein